MSAIVWRWLAAGAMALAAVSGCERQNGGDNRASLALEPCEREAGEPLPAVSGAECGTYSVPINREDTGSATIEVAIKRWPAISAVPEPDPVFVIAGGPGQSAIGVSDTLVQPFFNLRKKRDIVFVDQRGTGGSASMDCDSDSDHSLAVSMLDSEAQTLKTLKACAQKHRDFAPYVTTPHAVDDLEAVRRALGYGTINLWGGSYGTRVALRYMHQYPDSLRSVVMDGLAPVSLAIPQRVGEGANRALKKIARQCLDNSECQKRYGDIAETAEQLAARLAENPVRLNIPDPLTAAPREILVDAEKFAALVRFALYDRLLSRTLAHTLARAHAGDYRLLAALISQFLAGSELPSIATGMHVSVLCSEDARLPQAPSSEAFLGTQLSATLLQACQFWPTGALPDDYYAPVSSDIPALLLSGERDPVTPPKWGEQVAAHLSAATHLVAPGAHHGVTRHGCGGALMTEFIRALTLTDELSQCIDKIVPMPLYLSRIEADKSPESDAQKEPTP